MMLSHHAYLCLVKEVSAKSIKTFVDSLKIEEVEYILVDHFGIENVRILTNRAFMMPQRGSFQILAVCTNSITVEAQQALLKILEEPPKATVFVFCLPESLFLLPTLLSRFDKQKVSDTSYIQTNTCFVEFVELSLVERLERITTYLAAKDIIWVDKIKFGLLDKLADNPTFFTFNRLTQLFFVAEHLNTRGASNKLLLEELALSYPLSAEKL